jgi:hypothetical protein
MKNPQPGWLRNRGYGRSAALCCKASILAGDLCTKLKALNGAFDLADADTDMSVDQMTEAKEVESIENRLRELCQQVDDLLGKQPEIYVSKVTTNR